MTPVKQRESNPYGVSVCGVQGIGVRVWGYLSAAEMSFDVVFIFNLDNETIDNCLVCHWSIICMYMV